MHQCRFPMPAATVCALPSVPPDHRRISDRGVRPNAELYNNVATLGNGKGDSDQRLNLPQLPWCTVVPLVRAVGKSYRSRRGRSRRSNQRIPTVGTLSATKGP